MKFFAYLPLLGGFINLILALFVLLSDRRSRLNQVFFALGMSITIWNFWTFALFEHDNPSDAYQSAKIMLFGVIFVPVTMLHISLLLCGIRPGKWLAWVYAVHVILAGMNVADAFIAGVRHVGYAYYSIAGPGFKIYGLAFIQSFASIILLLKRRHALPVRQRARVNGILTAQTLLVVLGTNDLMPIFGLDYYPFTKAHILPYGSVAAAAYGLMVAYSIFQHQLLDVRVVLGQSAAYFVRFVFLLLIATMLELMVAAFAPTGQVTGFSIISTIGVITVSTLLASLFFPKLLGGAAEDLERRLLGDRFEYHDKIRSFIEQCRWQTELDPLLDDLDSLLIDTLQVRSYWLILRNETRHVFSVARAHPKDVRIQIPDLQNDSPAFQVFAGGRRSFLPLRSGIDGSDLLDDAGREELRAIPGELAFPLVIEENPLGLLILGEKSSGDDFTGADVRLLESLTKNIVLVINQILIRDQLLVNKELDLLGRMSRGMAHDLNNLTTPVWTLLQLLTEGASADALRGDLAPVATRNIQTMRDYIKEALFFSENLRPDFKTGRLDMLVKEVVDLARQTKRKGKNITYTLNPCGDVLVEMDQVLIRRLLTNIVANGVDASEHGGAIDVEISWLTKTESARDWIRVRVTDHGSGIKPENLDRIFHAYFTTKRTGDEDRGFGLGLAISRKIATLHGGNLVVSSEVGKGTTVNLDLPSRQLAAPASAMVAAEALNG